MRDYELTVVLAGGTTPAKKKSAIEKVEKLVATLKGKVGKVEDWGEKEFANKIGKNTSGVFLHFPLELEASAAKALNVKIKEEAVLRHLLVRKE